MGIFVVEDEVRFSGSFCSVTDVCSTMFLQNLVTEEPLALD